MNNRKYSEFIKRAAAILLAGVMITGCGAAKTGAGADTGSTQTGSTQADAAGTAAEAVSADKAAGENDASATAKTEEKAEAKDTTEAAEENTAVSYGTSEADTKIDQIIEIAPDEDAVEEAEAAIAKDGVYYSRDDVALYLYTYHELPSNFITKKEANKLGWEGGKLEPYAPGKAIGGDYFGNYEGRLPKNEKYHECDIDTKGKSRGAKRIVYSDSWNIYYTEDHYESFELLYSGEGK